MMGGVSKGLLEQVDGRCGTAPVRRAGPKFWCIVVKVCNRSYVGHPDVTRSNMVLLSTDGMRGCS